MQNEYTVPYLTYTKRALIEGLRQVFAVHPDPSYRYVPATIGDEEATGTKITVEFPVTKNQYPSIVVKFYERNITNMGIGHIEFLSSDSGFTYSKYKHYNFTGDIEFVILALSSTDRDTISDSLVQTLAMGDLADYTSNFYTRLYQPDKIVYPDSIQNFININTDIISGFGETQAPAPWQPEDVLVYQKSYRCGIFGEFYSLSPVTKAQFIRAVNVYPYLTGEPIPTGTPDPSPWE